MPSSAVRTFADPVDYAAAIRGGQSELTVTGRGRFAAKLTGIVLHRLWVQRFTSNLPWIGQTGLRMGRAFFSFRAQQGPSLFSDGVETRPGDVMRHNEGRSYYIRSSGLACTNFMSVPVEEIVRVGAAMA